MQVRGLSIEDAARYCGITPDTYKEWEREGWVPGPWPGTRRYDRKAIDRALDARSGIFDEPALDPLEEWRKRRRRGSG